MNSRLMGLSATRTMRDTDVTSTPRGSGRTSNAWMICGAKGVAVPQGPPGAPIPACGKVPRVGEVPTHPGEGQVHLQLGNAAADAGTDPVAKGDGAEGVVGGAVAPEPALGQEPLRLGEVGLIVGHRVVRQDEEGLRVKKWGCVNDPCRAPLGGPHSTAPTHVLGEEVVSDDNVLLIEDPGIGGHHRVDPGVWGELVGKQDPPGEPQGEKATGRTSPAAQQLCPPSPGRTWVGAALRD